MFIYNFVSNDRSQIIKLQKRQAKRIISNNAWLLDKLEERACVEFPYDRACCRNVSFNGVDGMLTVAYKPRKCEWDG